MSEKEVSLDNIVSIGNWSITVSGASLCLPQLLQSILLSTDKVLHTVSVSGTLLKPVQDLIDLLVSNGGRIISKESKATNHYILVWEDKSFLSFNHTIKDNSISVVGYAINEFLLGLESVLEKDFITKVKTKLIFTIVRTSSGLEIRSLGDGSTPLIKENYLPEVIKDIDYVVSSFSKVPPGGRICILNGEPGTGKTHLIRTVLARMDCVFLIIPANLIDSLDKPEFMPLLLGIKRDHDKPIVMVIEDGDTCLVPRKSDNISTISSLLNLSDGIMGSIMDIKMIISTNAEIKEMDQAIMRPGRLCRNIYVGPLPYDQANEVYKRLTKDLNSKLEFRKSYTLAEIYYTFNNADSPPDIQYTNASSNRRPIGFCGPSSDSKDLTINKSNG